MRRLEVPIAGRWYFGLMVTLGAVSLGSSNNVIYLMVSLLLSALLLSGFISSRMIRSVQAQVKRKPICALGENHDTIQVTNRGRLPVFCVEIEEWSGSKRHRLAFVPYLRGRSTLNLTSQAVLERRGSLSWDCLSVSSMYPYGFLRFIERFPGSGNRIVWPALAGGKADSGGRSEGALQSRGWGAVLEGEVRPMNHDDDPRGIVWTLSARGGDPMVRLRGNESRQIGLSLDLRVENGEEFEAKISAIATRIYGLDPSECESAVLTVQDRDGRRRIQGRSRILDCLATAQALGKAQSRVGA